MKVDGVNLSALISQYYYLDQTGLSHYFTSNTVDDNSGERFDQENKVQSMGQGQNYSAQDLQNMLNSVNFSANKFFILQLLGRKDMTTLLPSLQKPQMMNAMNLFSQSKLLSFLGSQPPQELITMLMTIMPMQQLLMAMPTAAIFNIMRSSRLQVSDMTEGFKKDLPVDQFQDLLQNITGQSGRNLKQRELSSMFKQLGKTQIINGMKGMPTKPLFNVINGAAQRDPTLLMMIPSDNLMNIIDSLPKPELVNMFSVFAPSQLMSFLTQLPDRAMALALSQLDDNTFSNLLISRYPDLIVQLAQAEAA